MRLDANNFGMFPDLIQKYVRKVLLKRCKKGGLLYN